MGGWTVLNLVLINCYPVVTIWLPYNCQFFFSGWDEGVAKVFTIFDNV